VTALLLKELVAFTFAFSYSERLATVPNWRDYPTDYEWRIGGRTKSFESTWGWEREIGQTGILRENRYVFEVKDIKFNEIEIGKFKLGGSDYARSIWDINYQEQYALFETSIPKFDLSVGVGASYLWENDFKNPAVCLKTTFGLNSIVDINFSQETDFQERCNRNLYIGKSFLYKLPVMDILNFRFTVYHKRLWTESKLRALQSKGNVELEFDLSKFLFPK